MPDSLAFHNGYLTLSLQAEDYDDIAQKLDGFMDRALLTQRGPFLGPLDESQGSAVRALRSAASSSRRAANECKRRGEVVLDFRADVLLWERTYGDYPTSEAPPRPTWTQPWSNT